jgi:hypothetical protein
MRKIISTLLSILLIASVSSCDVNTVKTSAQTETTEQITQHVTEETTKKEEPTTKVTTVATTAEETTEPTLNYAEIMSGLTLDNFPRIDGSTATIPLFTGYIRAITGCSEQEAELRSEFTTTDPSYYALSQGKTDLLLVYAPSNSTVQDLDVENTMDMREIGLDALVFIVNADNPIESLTADQIRDIYSGKVTNWKDVGGNDMPIVAFQRPEKSGSQTLMLELMMKDTVMMTPTTEVISDSMADLIDDVSAYDNSANSIGYSVYYYAKNMYTQPNLKFIAVDGVLPSNETINSGEYGYSHPFYGIIPLDPKPEAAALLDWILSDDGQRILEECGYVPIKKK